MIDPYPQDTKARELYRRAFVDGPGMAIGAITVALKEAESAALERAAQEYMHTVRRSMCPTEVGAWLRALASPAATPAAECPEPPPGWETMTTGPTAGCGNIATYRDPAPPPRAEAREPVNCWIQLLHAERRIAELEALISDLRDYAEDRRKYGTAKRVLGAQNSDAYLEQWALGTIHECDAVLERLPVRTSKPGAGEGTT